MSVFLYIISFFFSLLFFDKNIVNREYKDYNILVANVDSESLDELKGFGDEILNVLGSGIAVLGSDKSDKPIVVIVVTIDFFD